MLKNLLQLQANLGMQEVANLLNNVYNLVQQRKSQALANKILKIKENL